MRKKITGYIMDVLLLYCFCVVCNLSISVLSEPFYIVLLVGCAVAEVVERIIRARKKV